MLLRFRVRNHRSIRDEEEISLVASSLKDNSDGLISTDAVKGHKLLPALVVYGANASGKSNLVNAFILMRDHIRHSFDGTPGGKNVHQSTFALDRAYFTQHSTYDIEFIYDGIRYNYGFDVVGGIYSSEWLFTYPRNKRVVLFERVGSEYKFGRALRGGNFSVAGRTSENRLYLSAAGHLNHARLVKIAIFLANISITNTEAANFSLAFRPETDTTQDRVVDFLSMLGTGICAARIISDNSDITKRQFLIGVRNALTDVVSSSVASAFDPDDIKTLQLSHNGIYKDAYFNIEDESDGTRRLIFVMPRVFEALDTGSILIIDELNAHLHTHACEAILRLFCDPKTNPKGAQLIATTHDTNLLSADFLRRDQVWFAEKDQEGATHFYPLTDIKPHKGDNIQKGYLQGRYGAVPFASASSDLFRR